MIRKVLVANRGEIACRVLRALRELGIASVAIYSEADAGAPHTRLADEAVLIGPGPAKQSYLEGDKIVALALDRRCDALHPGYGFLSENAAFAGACESSGLIWIGPRAETIALMGSKTRAREVMAAAGVPVLPASGDLDQVDEALAAAGKIGYPLMLKAIAGGGGIGHKVIRSAEELKKEFPGASQRAELVFKNKMLFLEKFLERPRHVEVQVLGDDDGEVIHLFERECSLQRRHQKVIEETPAPGLDADARARLLACAVAGAKRAGYENAGTLEFLLDAEGSSREGASGSKTGGDPGGACGAGSEFYFMEMNTRLQVEHPVTEMTTGIDLVKAQLAIAGGAPLAWRQEDVRQSGHAIELRVYAEDPARNFAPQPGKLARVEWPSGEGVRCDAGYESGMTVPPYYDPLLAKVVAHGPTRADAIARARGALERTAVEGIRTNLGLLRRILGDPAFQRGSFDTLYLTERKELLT
jgi:acetyl/propionyl-CoA carboxylase alpha subunit